MRVNLLNDNQRRRLEALAVAAARLPEDAP